MHGTGTFPARLLPVVGSNVAIIVLAFIGLAVVSSFSEVALFVLLFIISLMQGGLMVRAFGPAVGSETHLSYGGKIVGVVGLIGWFLAHLLNAGIVAMSSIQGGLQAVLVELLVFGMLNMAVLSPFYLEPIRARHRKRQEQRGREEFERSRPEREQSQQLTLKTQQAKAQQREQIGFDVRLFYDRYRRELADVFPEDKFAAYFHSFLTDATATDVFELRAERLKNMIRERLEISSRRRTLVFDSIEDVIAHYDDKRSLIISLPVEEEVQKEFLMQLDDSMERDLREFL